MTSHVIDTSALIKYVLPEQESGIVEHLVALHHAGVVDLAAPEYLLVECANVLWKHLQRNNVQIEDAVPSLRVLKELGNHLVPNLDLLDAVLLFAQDHGVAVCDALFGVLAARESALRITSDAALVRRLSGTGIQAVSPSDWPGPG